MDRGALRCVLPLPTPRPTTAHPKAPWRGTPAAAGIRFERGPAFPQGSSTQTSAGSNLLPSLFSVSTVRRGRIGDQFPQSKSNMAETEWQIRPILQLAPMPAVPCSWSCCVACGRTSPGTSFLGPYKESTRLPRPSHTHTTTTIPHPFPCRPFSTPGPSWITPGEKTPSLTWKATARQQDKKKNKEQRGLNSLSALYLISNYQPTSRPR